MADNRLVEISNLSKRFDKLVVLDNISIDVHKGENLVVFGRSGTGKSVLLKCIIGLLKPDSGYVHIEGKDVINMSIKELNKARKKIGFLFQSGALYDSMTVRENLGFTLVKTQIFLKTRLKKR